MSIEPHRVTTYGGQPVEPPMQNNDGSPIRTVQHWQLRLFGEFIADTSNPHQAAVYERIVAAVKAGEP